MTDEILVGEKQNTQWRMSASIGKLVEALAKAQLKFDPVFKESANPFFKSKYADLATVIESTRKHLASEGISVMQLAHADDTKLTVTTLMAHTSDEWISSDLTLPAMNKDRLDAQSVGSAITYARRYALAAITGVAQEDDDGNSATGNTGSKQAAQQVATDKLKTAASSGNKTAQTALAKSITITRPEEHNGNYIHVAGYMNDSLLMKFFTDTESRGFISKSDGSQYYRVPSDYEKDLIVLCGKLNIPIE